MEKNGQTEKQKSGTISEKKMTAYGYAHLETDIIFLEYLVFSTGDSYGAAI